MADYEVQEELREVLHSKFGMNGIDMVSHLEALVNDGQSMSEQADDAVETLIRIKPALRQFLDPIFGGNEGIVDMLILEGIKYDFFTNFEILREPEIGKSYLICCDVINNMLGADPETYLDTIYQLVDEGKLEIHELLSEDHLLVCSSGNALQDSLFRDKLSPHRRDKVLSDKDGQFSTNYRPLPVMLHLTEKGTYFGDNKFNGISSDRNED